MSKAMQGEGALFPEELFEPVETLARRQGVWAELWGEVSEGLSVERRDRRLYAVEPWQETILAVRVIRSGRAGLAYTTQASPEAVRKATEKALEMSLFSEEEAALPEENSLPDLPERQPEIPSPEFLENLLVSAEEAALSAEPRVHRFEKVSLSVERTVHLVFQTEGLKAVFRTGGASFFVALVARKEEEERTAWEWREAPELEALKVKELAREAALRAAALLGAHKISSRKLAVLFPPGVAVQILGTLSPSLCADEVVRGRSQLAGKVGKRVFAPAIKLLDDGLLPGGPETRPFDDEGAPQKRTVLVEEGYLRGFLCDTRWGRAISAGSTGNARRPSFKSLPSVAPTNFYLEPGKVSPERLRQAASEVLEIHEMLGWHTTDPVSGDFSVGISGVLHRPQGPQPVSGLALSGNLFDLLRRVELLGEDLTFYGATGSPSLFIPDLDLSGE